MTLEIKSYQEPAVIQEGISRLTGNSLSFTIFFSNVHPFGNVCYAQYTSDYEYIRDVDTGKYYIKGGKWCENDDKKSDTTTKPSDHDGGNCRNRILCWIQRKKGRHSRH